MRRTCSRRAWRCRAGCRSRCSPSAQGDRDRAEHGPRGVCDRRAAWAWRAADAWTRRGLAAAADDSDHGRQLGLSNRRAVDRSDSRFSARRRAWRMCCAGRSRWASMRRPRRVRWGGRPRRRPICRCRRRFCPTRAHAARFSVCRSTARRSRWTRRPTRCTTSRRARSRPRRRNWCSC